LRVHRDAKFPHTEFDEAFVQRPAEKGLIDNSGHKLHKTLGVPYVHIQSSQQVYTVIHIQQLQITPPVIDIDCYAY